VKRDKRRLTAILGALRYKTSGLIDKSQGLVSLKKGGDMDNFEDACHGIAKEIAEVVISKQRDYGHGNILAFGEFGVLVRANDKMERMKNLQKAQGEPSNESIDDTWIDLAGYSIIALMLRKGIFTLP
jgi:hypothetical protein